MSENDLTKLDKQVEKMFNDVIDVCIEEYYSKNLEDTIYESVDDYKTKTGKRFRRTKDQMARGLTVDESFSEFLESSES